MMGTLFCVISWMLLIPGSFLCVTGCIGVLRFPDFYTRMHAAGVTDSLGAGLILMGLMFQSPNPMVLLKLILILLFTLLTGPTASHALAKAAVHGELTPYRKECAGEGVPISKS